MIYVAMPKEIVTRRKAFLHKWRRLPPSPSKSARTTNAIARLHEEFKRRIITRAFYRP
jgi:transposase-like protein